MATTYHLPDRDLLYTLYKVMGIYYPELEEAGVKVAILFADNPDGPAIKVGGYPALACVRVTPLRDRMFVEHDALIQIDTSAWGELTPQSQEAVLLHELLHLELAKPTDADLDNDPDQPKWKTDDLGRPKLKIRPGDWNGGDGFRQVVEIYGQAAVEARNAIAVAGAVRQTIGKTG
jgi:hypothetical protein